VALDIWHVAKARAEIWRLVKSVDTKSLDDVKAIAKGKFREMAMVHHPDHGGDHNAYIKIQAAYDIIDAATIHSFISALDTERELQTSYHKPGSPECVSCGKWSSVIGGCMTTTCTGYVSQRKNASSFFDRGSQRPEQAVA
jgi:hypothetical protein